MKRPAKRSARPNLVAARDWAIVLTLVSALWWYLPYPSPAPGGLEGRNAQSTKG